MSLETKTSSDHRVEETPADINERFRQVIADAALDSFSDEALGYVDPETRASDRREIANAAAQTRAERATR